MYNEIKKKAIFLLPLLLILIPLSSALTITDTTFFASSTNFTIFVDTITLDNVTITDTQIQFYNLTSTGSNFLNSNATFTAIAEFYGLSTGLTIRNVNTSTDLFTSASGDQNFNATFTSGQTIRIMSSTTSASCSTADKLILNLTLIFLAIVLMAVPLGLFFLKGKINIEITPQLMIIIFMAIILGVILIQPIADSIILFCPN